MKMINVREKFNPNWTPVQRREALICALRSPMVNWDWDYGQTVNVCGTAGCAMGYAATLGIISDAWNDRKIQVELGLNVADFKLAFYDAGWKGGLESPVSPTEVAAILAAAPYEIS